MEQVDILTSLENQLENLINKDQEDSKLIQFGDLHQNQINKIKKRRRQYASEMRGLERDIKKIKKLREMYEENPAHGTLFNDLQSLTYRRRRLKNYTFYDVEGYLNFDISKEEWMEDILYKKMFPSSITY